MVAQHPSVSGTKAGSWHPQPRPHQASNKPHQRPVPHLQHSSRATSDTPSLRICRIFSRIYKKVWTRGKDRRSLFLPGELQHSSDLQYGNGTVAELVICLVINIKDGTVNSTLKDKIQRRTRERRKTSEKCSQLRETSPSVWKGIGPRNQESQTHHAGL